MMQVPSPKNPQAPFFQALENILLDPTQARGVTPDVYAEAWQVIVAEFESPWEAALFLADYAWQCGRETQDE